MPKASSWTFSPQLSPISFIRLSVLGEFSSTPDRAVSGADASDIVAAAVQEAIASAVLES